jgi:hypothetical protein
LFSPLLASLNVPTIQRTPSSFRFLADSTPKDSKDDATTTEKKPKYKGRNLYDILTYLDNFGVGWR